MRLLTYKQITVLKAINRFGAITSRQLIDYLHGCVSHVTIYTAKQKLLQLNMIEELKIGKTLVMYIKPTGVNYLESELTPFTKVNMSLLEHQLTMIDCILFQINLYRSKGLDFRLVTERELRSNYINRNYSLKERRSSNWTTILKGITYKIPDYVFIVNDKKIAYEVELTQKSARRYEEILNKYKNEHLNGKYDHVRYLCKTQQILKTVNKHAKEVGMVKGVLQLELIERVMKLAEKQRPSE